MKRFFKIIIPVILIFGICFMLFKTIKKIEHKNKIALQINKIPKFEFLEIYSNKKFSNELIEKNKPTLFVYFNTECEHCLYEAEQISQNTEQFGNCQILLVSFEETDILQAFAEKYNFVGQNKITVLQDKKFEFDNIFGHSPLPTSFIYNKKGKLIKKVVGEVKIEALLQYLNE